MNRKVMVVGSAKTKTVKRRPRIRLAGFWLNSIGFTPESLVSARYENKSIVLKSEGSGLNTYKALAGRARKANSGLLQVTEESHNKKCIPHLEIKGFWLETLGFEIGSVIVVITELGSINIKLLELDKLGF